MTTMNHTNHDRIAFDRGTDQIYKLPSQIIVTNSDGTSSIISSTAQGKRHAELHMWNPIWLSNSVIVAFIALFLSLLAATLVLFSISERNHGLSQQIEANHYSWTYGPTAILVVIVSLWRQVDYYCKELAPWTEMQQGPTPAEKSILLDYISPIIPTSLWMSIRNRHWAVVLSTFGFLILKLTVSYEICFAFISPFLTTFQIVLSTGLLVLTPVSMSSQDIPLTTATDFDAAGFDLANVSPDPTYQFYGNQARGLAWPAGTNEHLAVQTFRMTNSTPLVDASVSGEVLGFSVDPKCEKINSTDISAVHYPWKSIQALYFVTNVSTPTCEIGNVTVGQSADHGYFRLVQNGTVNYQGLWRDYTCGENLGGRYPTFSLPGNKSSDDIRLLFTMSEVQWDFVNGSSASDLPKTQNWRATRLSGFLCKPSYSIDRYNVKISQNQTVLSYDKIVDTSSNLPGFNNDDLLRGIQASIVNSTFGQGGNDYIFQPVPSAFMLLAGMNNNSRQEPLIDETTLGSLTERALRGIGAQMGSQFLRRDKQGATTGSSASIQERLVVKMLIVGLMVTAFGLMALISLALFFLRPQNVISCEPESVASAAAILSSSHDLRNYLKDRTVTASTTRLSKLFGYDKFQTQSIDDQFAIKPLLSHESPEIRHGDAYSTNSLDINGERWWRPIGVKLPFILALLILPLLLIGLLEGVQQLSDKQHGLADLGLESASMPLGATFIPALAMLGIATMYTSLEFAVSVIAPFVTLRQGGAPASRSISVSLVGKLPPLGFALSLRNKHFAHCLAIAAAFIASFLTIVVSGLYSPAWVPQPLSVRATQMDIFNFSHVDTSLDDNFAGAATKLIMYSNLTWPKGTYDNLVFPTLSAPKDVVVVNTTGSDESQGQITTFSAKVPALRGSLKCHDVNAESVNITAFYWSGATSTFTGGSSGGMLDEGSVKLLVKANFSWSLCDHPPKSAPAQAVWGHYFILPNDTETTAPSVPVGIVSTIQWQGPSIGDTGYERVSTLSLDVSAYGCPSVGIMVGNASGKKSNRIGLQQYAANPARNVSFWDIDSDLTISVCSQVLEEVQTDVTLALPNYSIDQSNPPVPDEKTVKTLVNANSSAPSIFDDPWLNPSPSVLNSTSDAGKRDNWFGIALNTFMNAVQGIDGGRGTLDGFLVLISKGKDAIPLSELTGKKNRDTLIKTVSRAYGWYAAQLINTNMRSTQLPDGQKMPVYGATIGTPRRRLVQNRGPTIALQAILAVMVICGFIAWLLARSRNVLKHNPCSIAGKMVLLGRSEFCSSSKVLPEGAERWDDATRKKYALFEGWFFSLGWWSTTPGVAEITEYGGPGATLIGTGRERWYGIDVGRAEK